MKFAILFMGSAIAASLAAAGVSALTLFDARESTANALAARLQAHPLVNTATIAFDHAGLETFLAATGHRPVVLDVPTKRMRL